MRKLTKAKIVLALITIFMLLFPFYMLNINFSKYLINSVIVLDSKMVVISVFFLIYLVLYIISNKSKKNKEVSNKDENIVKNAPAFRRKFLNTLMTMNMMLLIH